MRLIRAETFAERFFDAADRPDNRTVRSWVELQIVPGRIIGRNVYVDVEAFEATPSTGNQLADLILTRGKAANA